MTRPIDAVIFDLDGVIVDSEIWWDDVRKAFAARHGREWTIEDRHAVMGRNSRQWSEIMRDRLRLDLSAAEIERAVVEAMVARYAREGAPAIVRVGDDRARLAAVRSELRHAGRAATARTRHARLADLGRAGVPRRRGVRGQ